MCVHCLVTVARWVFPRPWKESDGARLAAFSQTQSDHDPCTCINTPPSYEKHIQKDFVQN